MPWDLIRQELGNNWALIVNAPVTACILLVIGFCLGRFLFNHEIKLLESRKSVMNQRLLSKDEQIQVMNQRLTFKDEQLRAQGITQSGTEESVIYIPGGAKIAI
jgi:hypothetical protein